MMAKDRGIIKMIFTNFINSLRPRQIRGNLMGEDRFGNKYFEIPADRRLGKSRPSRWFVPTVKNKYDQELVPEWEAWLRGRRKEPPGEEELVKNFTISSMTKANVAELEAKNPTKRQIATGTEEKSEFPKYQEYEITPGAPPPDSDKEK